MADAALTVSQESLAKLNERMDELQAMRARLERDMAQVERLIERQVGAIGLMSVLLDGDATAEPAPAVEADTEPAPVEPQPTPAQVGYSRQLSAGLARTWALLRSCCASST